MAPQIKFCRSADGTQLAFVDLGRSEDRPLFFVQAAGGSLHSFFMDFFDKLASRRRVIVFDRRGTGASAPKVARLSLETELEDIAAVADHLHLREFDVWGVGEGVAVAAAYAATEPDRVSHLILFGGFASGPKISQSATLDAFKALVLSNWRMARNSIADRVFPSGPSEEKVRLASAYKDSLEPEMAARIFVFVFDLDVTEKLREIRCPTLVLHRRNDAIIPAAAAKELASYVPDARLVLLDGDVAIPHYNYEQYIDIVWEFLGEAPTAQVESPARIGASAFRAVLFTDLVGHTEMMSRLGDERGRDVLRKHERITRDVLKANGGTEVKTMGDGFMASFGSVTKAVECAVALQRAIDERNRQSNDPANLLSVRIGLNAGEPIEEDGDLFGSTVILASRIAAKAEGGEILVADTVRGLCSGKGFLFADRGEFVAKGFEEPVRVYEVSWQG